MKIHGSQVRGWTSSFSFVLCATGLALAQQGSPLPTPTNTAGADANHAGATATGATKPSIGAGLVATTQEAPKFLRYVRAASGGAKVRNIYDAQGVAIADVEAGTVLAVHGERAGWLEVESPAGFSVWVYGEYLTPTTESGVLSVSGNDVRMRPLPSSGAESLPLRQLLQKGQRLRMLGRKDLAKPLAEDWVNVGSPVGSRGWVATTQTEALPADQDGATLWGTAVGEARKPLTGTPITSAAVAGGAEAATGGSNASVTTDSKKISAALGDADKQLAAARSTQEQGGSADYDAVKAAYEAVLALGPGEATTKLVKDRIELCSAYADGANLSAELERQKQSIDAALSKRRDEMARAARRQPFDGRFDGRGRIEKATLPGESRAVYFLRFGGELVAELGCASGRLDFADFLGCEVGFNGTETRGPIRSTTAALNRPRAFDVARLEVIAAPAKGQR
ncbi:MAG: hypothetical protein FJ294_02130 [Planctomycetes bacterium]|nr:hypothetical protein [Planctomycetota bacterium]